jgi:hypothetical protein
MSDGADEAAGLGPVRYGNGRFGPGNPGRRAGSRNRISQRLVMSILADFERNRENVLQRLRTENAAAYARLVARFLPPDEVVVSEEAASEGDADGEAAGALAFAGVGSEALTEALARLDAIAVGADWSKLSSAEDFLMRETRKARLARDVAAALAATDEADDRSNGESTVGSGEE